MKLDPNELRQRFLDFFDARMKEHAKANGGGVDEGESLALPSSSLVPHGDPSTLFTSAGMHQFKDDFTGNLRHSTRAAATVQKCMRTPDLENVGKTPRHHTFFEMLGFFSFGDGMKGPNGSVGFFKKEAIRWIWDFYTLPWNEGGCGIDKDKLYVSVYGGDENGKDRDIEAADLWKEILAPLHPGVDLDKERIFYLGEHDNFWPAGAPSQGPNGVCGPCSEIFYDLGEEWGEGNVETNDNRFMEIGNIVFTQFERSGPVPGKGTLTPLPQKNIDFGGGFERLVMVLEGERATLETSLFMPIRYLLRRQLGELVLDSRKRVKTNYDLICALELYEARRDKEEYRQSHLSFEKTKSARKVRHYHIKKSGELPDTLRAVVLAAVVGEVEGNYTFETSQWFESGNVRERRIADHIRAAVFCVADGVSPGKDKADYIVRRIVRRAYRDGTALGFDRPFLHKLVPVLVEHYGDAYPELRQNPKGLANIIEAEESHFAETLEKGLQLLAGHIRDVKKSGGKMLDGQAAFDLYQSHGLPEDVTRDELLTEGIEFDEVGFEDAKRKHAEVSGAGKKAELFDKGWFAVVKANLKPTEFLGYDATEAEGNVLAIEREGQLVDELAGDSHAVIVLDRTPFYAESGGQVGDTGVLLAGDSVFEVTDTTKRDDYFLHEGKLTNGKLRTGDTVQANVNVKRRERIKSNHSATHLMHQALRDVLGEHVLQKGSEVSDKHLRFDFSHNKAVSFEERQEIERRVNEEIRRNTEVCTDLMKPEEAQKAGALALFGEKYGDEVRVLSMGSPGDSRPFSRELCGGTHVARTGDIGYFRITGEGSSSAGVRRIFAVTGKDAYDLASEEAKQLAELQSLTKAQPGQIVEKVNGLLKQVKDLKSQAKKGGGVDDAALKKIRDNAETIGDVTVYVGNVPNAEAADLLTIKDALGQDANSTAILLGSPGEDRVLLLLSFTKDLVGRGLHAGKIVGEMARLVGGGGGGKPDIAQAGGKKPEGLAEALELGLSKIREALQD